MIIQFQFKQLDDNIALEMISEIPRTDPKIAGVSFAIPVTTLNTKLEISPIDFPQSGFILGLGRESPVNLTFSEKIKLALERHKRTVKFARVSILNLLIGAYFAWATYHYIDLSEF